VAARGVACRSRIDGRIHQTHLSAPRTQSEAPRARLPPDLTPLRGAARAAVKHRGSNFHGQVSCVTGSSLSSLWARGLGLGSDVRIRVCPGQASDNVTSCNRNNPKKNCVQPLMPTEHCCWTAMTYSSCLQKFGAANPEATCNISFALSEISPSAYTTCQIRQPSARIKAKRDRGEEIDYVDLANGEIKLRARSSADTRTKKVKPSTDPSEVEYSVSTSRSKHCDEDLETRLTQCIHNHCPILLLDDSRLTTVSTK
jgi:hypothetical protein